jgi:hypothetical protein
MVVSACGGGGTTIVVPPPPPPPAGFRITLTPDAEDVVAAQALGWSAGIPGADVTLTPTDSSFPTRTVTSSAAGVADFGETTPKNYIVEVRRWLTATELGRLPAGQDVDGWAARASLAATAGGGLQTLTVPASRRKSLVISEWAFNNAGFPGIGDYPFGGFLELYNNADTTIYLDGMIVGEGWESSLGTPIFPCAMSGPWRDDPQGIWARFFQLMPGSGQQYPLLPGRVSVIATDAIDHRSLVPGGLDLRGADFEFSGLLDADNPAVPNLTEIGRVVYPAGHGLQFGGAVAVPFVSLPVDISSLPVAFPFGTSSNSSYARFPADRILDALSIGRKYLEGFPDCPPLVNARFDREASRARGTTNELEEYPFSVSRRAIPVLSSGRRVLQDSRSGNADFVRTPKSPGTLPPN